MEILHRMSFHSFDQTVKGTKLLKFLQDPKVETVFMLSITVEVKCFDEFRREDDSFDDAREGIFVAEGFIVEVESCE
jgi:hypothetical protein